MEPNALENAPKIRAYQAEDVPVIRRIYEHYIATSVTFEYALPSAESLEKRLAEIAQNYPVLVCVVDGQVCGYAYAHALGERAAFQWSAELSVYLHPQFAGRGLGGLLYDDLLRCLQAQGIRSAFACVTSPNPASEKFHAKMGFALAGRLHRAGFKNGRWHDILWFEKLLGPYDSPLSS